MAKKTEKIKKIKTELGFEISLNNGENIIASIQKKAGEDVEFAVYDNDGYQVVDMVAGNDIESSVQFLIRFRNNIDALIKAVSKLTEDKLFTTAKPSKQKSTKSKSTT